MKAHPGVLQVVAFTSGLLVPPFDLGRIFSKLSYSAEFQTAEHAGNAFISGSLLLVD